MNISFIGVGIMAEAIIRGILGANIASSRDISVSDPIKLRRQYLTETYDVSTYSSNVDVISESELVILSVKPQNLKEVVWEIKSSLSSENTVVSIIAGASMQSLCKELDHNKVIRLMPNTPAQIGQGITVWTSSTEVSESVIESIRKILKTLGDEIYVDEEKYIDMATALSASGPAYVFMFIESLIDAGVYLGMSREMSRKLTLETILGSTKLLKSSDNHPATLKDMVTSPGGTTAEGLLALEQGLFKSSVMRAVISAFNKSRTLGKQN